MEEMPEECVEGNVKDIRWGQMTRLLQATMKTSAFAMTEMGSSWRMLSKRLTYSTRL